MPVEIRELIIKAVVSDNRSNRAQAPGSFPDNRERFLSECVEEIMQILKDKQER